MCTRDLPTRLGLICSFVCLQQVKGKTLLPLPPGSEKITEVMINGDSGGDDGDDTVTKLV